MKPWKTIVDKKNIDFVDNNKIIEEHLGSKSYILINKLIVF